MRNDALAHERNLVRKDQLEDDGRHWLALADALRDLGAEVTLAEQLPTKKILAVNGHSMEHRLRLRSRPARSHRGDRPSQWCYRFLVGDVRGRVVPFVQETTEFDYVEIAKEVLRQLA